MSDVMTLSTLPNTTVLVLFPVETPTWEVAFDIFLWKTCDSAGRPELGICNCHLENINPPSLRNHTMLPERRSAALAVDSHYRLCIDHMRLSVSYFAHVLIVRTLSHEHTDTHTVTSSLTHRYIHPQTHIHTRTQIRTHSLHKHSQWATNNVCV